VKGTGLGLPLTKNLAQLLGGKVTLQSELGVGSTFSVYVPVVLPGWEEEQHSQLPELDPARQPVVLIEDNRETAFVMEKMLESSEFQLISAHTIETGMDFVQGANPVTVILDVLIDGESSWETLRRLRERRIPVLMISVVPSAKAKAIALGADAFLPKPVSRDTLVQSLRAVTHRGEVHKVLLIDDDELSRYSLSELLSAKVNITEARSGREGLLLASEDPPDVVFLDMHMPDMSGLEVLRQLRLSDACRDIPVVIHSSQEMSEDDKLSLRLPLVTILSKRDTSGPDAMKRINQALMTVGFTLEPRRSQHA
jgi:CheY-like chemotaxis protein